MNTYEKTQLEELQIWQTLTPPPVSRWFGRAAGPASEAVQTLIPPVAFKTALDALQNTAGWLGGTASLLRAAKIADVAALREADLETCDRLADRVRRRAAVAAGGSGALLGVAGGIGMIIDVPTLLVLAFRTIRQTGLCYGETLDDERGRRLALAIFALASANTAEEKQSALAALHQPGGAEPVDAAWRDGVERAAERELAKEAAMLSLSNLASQAGRRLGWRKAAGSLPLVGAVVGGSVNAWYLWDLATVARYCFQERWLMARHGQRPAIVQPRAARQTRKGTKALTRRRKLATEPGQHVGPDPL